MNQKKAIMKGMELCRIYKDVKTPLLDGEYWMPVFGVDKNIDYKYSYSNMGRIKSNERKVNAGWGNRIVKEKILPQHENWRGKGYLIVGLSYGKGSKYITVHKLIATSALANPNSLSTVNHKDLDPKNNRIENLEWASFNDNIKHYQNCLLDRINNGEIVSNYRFTKEQIIDIFLSTDKYKDISTKYSVNWKTIGDIKSGATFKEITKHLPKNMKRRERLSKDKILDIYKNRNLPVRIMMNKYGLSEGPIIAIRTGRRYTNITMHNRTFKRPCGENSRRSKLKDNDVIEILKSSKKCRELAKVYGVAHSQIHSIRSGKTWKHISSPHNERYGLDK